MCVKANMQSVVNVVKVLSTMVYSNAVDPVGIFEVHDPTQPNDIHRHTNTWIWPHNMGIERASTLFARIFLACVSSAVLQG